MKRKPAKPSEPLSIKSAAGRTALVGKHIDTALATAMRENVGACVTYGEPTRPPRRLKRRFLHLWIGIDNVTVVEAFYAR